ncbi:unnamed protein product [Closterium sp. Naga37s-1]|nr:unnamed protein product [Closterium sp. Naga37s-1]
MQALAALHRCPPHTLFLEAGLWNGGKGEEEAGSEGACIPEEEFLHNAHLRKLGASSSGEGWEGFPVEGQGDAGSAYPSGGHRGVSLREVAGVSRAVGLLKSKPAAAAAAGAGGAEIAGGAGGDEGAGGTGESMGAMRSQLEVNPQAGGSGASSPGASSQAAPSSPTPSASLPDPQALAELNALLAFKASVIVFNDLLASWTVPRSAFSASSAPSANSVPSASPASSAASPDPYSFLCAWRFVTCSPARPGGARRVVGLSMTRFGPDLDQRPVLMLTRRSVLEENWDGSGAASGGGSSGDLGSNRFTGGLPADLSSCYLLYSLDVSGNLLSGQLSPSFFTSLAGTSVGEIFLANNSFEGNLPSEIGDVVTLGALDASGNRLSGKLPELKSCTLDTITTQLRPSPIFTLGLAGNLLEGPVPAAIGNLTSARTIDVSGNRLSGSLPPTLSQLQVLRSLSVSGNNLSSHLPAELSALSLLTSLDVSRNDFNGPIPPQLASPFLPRLLYLNLSHNHFVGAIPYGFSNTNTSATALDFSFNNLLGQIPFNTTGTPLSAYALQGNLGLCGGFGYASCPTPPYESTGGVSPGAIAGIAVGCAAFVAALVVLLVLLWLWLFARRRGPSLDGGTMLVFEKLGFKLTVTDVVDATEDFSNKFLLGRGGFGSVYRATLQDGRSVAIKRLALGSSQGQREFEAEMNTLGNVRHRNLVVLVAAYLSPPPAQERLLIYDFLPGGSLDQVLAREMGKDSPMRRWAVRRNILEGTARALKYLHQDCTPGIIHRDMKPANILLDENLEAKVADFGLAREADASRTHMSTSVFGTVGYLSPEYSQRGRLSFKSDVFAFGVLVLQVITGKLPTDSDVAERGLASAPGPPSCPNPSAPSPPSCPNPSAPGPPSCPNPSAPGPPSCPNPSPPGPPSCPNPSAPGPPSCPNPSAPGPPSCPNPSAPGPPSCPNPSAPGPPSCPNPSAPGPPSCPNPSAPGPPSCPNPSAPGPPSCPNPSAPGPPSLTLSLSQPLTPHPHACRWVGMHTVASFVDDRIDDALLYEDEIMGVVTLALQCTQTVPADRPSMPEALEVLENLHDFAKGIRMGIDAKEVESHVPEALKVLENLHDFAKGIRMGIDAKEVDVPPAATPVPHPPCRIPDSAIPEPHSPFRIPPSTVPRPYSPFPIPPSAFRHPHSPCRIPDSAIPQPHSPFRILPSAFPLPHSPFRIPPSAFSLPHSPFRSAFPLPHSPFRIPPSALPSILQTHSLVLPASCSLPRAPPPPCPSPASLHAPSAARRLSQGPGVGIASSAPLQPPLPPPEPYGIRFTPTSPPFPLIMPLVSPLLALPSPSSCHLPPLLFPLSPSASPLFPSASPPFPPCIPSFSPLHPLLSPCIPSFPPASPRFPHQFPSFPPLLPPILPLLPLLSPSASPLFPPCITSCPPLLPLLSPTNSPLSSLASPPFPLCFPSFPPPSPPFPLCFTYFSPLHPLLSPPASPAIHPSGLQ